MKRFWDKADRDGECWEWNACTNPDGYGRFRSEGKTYLAHRFAWELTNEPIPEGMLVCHTCDNRRCVNPEHLWLGTTEQNMDDMRQKKREKRSLSDDAIRSIRASKQSRKVLAAEYGVCVATISHAINHRTWKEVS